MVLKVGWMGTHLGPKIPNAKDISSMASREGEGMLFGGDFLLCFCNNLSCCTINIYIISSTASREGEGKLFGGEASSRARSPHWQLRSTGLNSVIISGALSRCLGSFI